MIMRIWDEADKSCILLQYAADGDNYGIDNENDDYENENENDDYNIDNENDDYENENENDDYDIDNKNDDYENENETDDYNIDNENENELTTSKLDLLSKRFLLPRLAWCWYSCYDWDQRVHLACWYSWPLWYCSFSIKMFNTQESSYWIVCPQN